MRVRKDTKVHHGVVLGDMLIQEDMWIKLTYADPGSELSTNAYPCYIKINAITFDDFVDPTLYCSRRLKNHPCPKSCTLLKYKLHIHAKTKKVIKHPHPEWLCFRAGLDVSIPTPEEMEIINLVIGMDSL